MGDTYRTPTPTPPNSNAPSPVKQSSPPSNAAHQDILANIEQWNRSLLVAQQALTCKLVLSISLSQQGMSVRPSRRTLTRVASAAVASLVIVAPISTVSNADALSNNSTACSRSKRSCLNRRSTDTKSLPFPGLQFRCPRNGRQFSFPAEGCFCVLLDCAVTQTYINVKTCVFALHVNGRVFRQLDSLVYLIALEGRWWGRIGGFFALTYANSCSLQHSTAISTNRWKQRKSPGTSTKFRDYLWRWGESNPRPTADPEVFSERSLRVISQPLASCRPATR